MQGINNSYQGSYNQFQMFYIPLFLIVLVSTQTTNTSTLTLSSTDQVGNLLSDAASYDIFYQGFYLSKITGYNDRPFSTAPWHLQRLELTFTSLPSAVKPSTKIINIGTGFRSPLDQPIAGSIALKYIKNIRLGFDKIGLCFVSVIDENNNLFKFGTEAPTNYYFTLSIEGYLGGVKGQAGTAINSIAFYLLPLQTQFGLQGISQLSKYYRISPSLEFFLSKITGFLDKANETDPLEVCKILLEYQSIVNKTLAKIFQIGACFNPQSMQVAGTVLKFQFRDQGKIGIDKVENKIVNIWYEDRYANVVNMAFGSPAPSSQYVLSMSNRIPAGGFGYEQNGTINSFGFYYFPG